MWFCFQQDEKNQVLVTNVWLDQVGKKYFIIISSFFYEITENLLVS